MTLGYIFVAIWVVAFIYTFLVKKIFNMKVAIAFYFAHYFVYLFKGYNFSQLFTEICSNLIGDAIIICICYLVFNTLNKKQNNVH